MGHIRLGRLPKSQRWRTVVELLDSPQPDAAAVASATVLAASIRLIKLQRDPAVAHCFWLLTRLASAARRSDFVDALPSLGLHAQPTDSILGFIAHVSDRVRADVEQYPESGPFSELASLALRRALTETIGQEGRSLFGSSIDDLVHAFRRHSSPVQFGVLAKSYFADFFARTLRFYVEKELSNRAGTSPGFANAEDGQKFAEALDLYARQSARIMEDFAVGWYGKHDWESKGAIGRDEAQGFVAVALRKLRQELAQTEAGRS